MAFFFDSIDQPSYEFDYAVYFRSLGHTIKGECKSISFSEAIHKVRAAAIAEGAPIDGAILVRIK